MLWLLGVVLPDEDPEEIQNTIDVWCVRLGAVTEPERCRLRSLSMHILMHRDCRQSQKATKARIYHNLHDGFDDRESRLGPGPSGGDGDRPGRVAPAATQQYMRDLLI